MWYQLVLPRFAESVSRKFKVVYLMDVRRYAVRVIISEPVKPRSLIDIVA